MLQYRRRIDQLECSMASPLVDTTTLLCADIGWGFSRDQPDWQATVACCDAAFDAAVAAHGGRIEGGRVAAFGAAGAALDAALAIQRVLHAEQAGPPLIRMALHAGHTCTSLDRVRQI